MHYLIAKALHLIGVVTWFAGLFYIVRLFIYDVEAGSRPAAERDILRAQFTVMQRRLYYGITWPAMLLTATAGLYLLANHGRPLAPWLLVKYALLVPLFAYHFTCGRIYRSLRAGSCGWSSQGLRIFNEVATVLLIAIVLVAVLKDAALTVWLPVSLFGVALVLGLAVFAYKRLRRA